MDTRKSKVITDKNEIDRFVALKEEDITTSFMMETFGEFDGKCKYRPYDIITIPANSYGNKKKNKNEFTTVLGLFIFNKYFLERDFTELFGYINETVDGKVFGRLDKRITDEVLLGRMDLQLYDRFLMKTQKCMPYISILAPNYTDKMLTCTRVINKKKHELLQKYKKEIEAGDNLIGDKMEKELLDFALEYLKDDPSMDMFLSGARGSIGNNFKNMFVMKGVIRNPDPNAKQRYTVAMSSYIDGISPEEYALFANSLAAGPFARARKTKDGGYLEKLVLRAYQHITLDPAGSDCKTTRTLKITLTKKNVELWMYSYIVEGEKLIELTPDNQNKYMDKNIKIRFSALCESKTGICNKCMGNLFYRIGIKNVGTVLPSLASRQKNIAMKAFHDSTQQLYNIDISSVFLDD